MFGAIECHIICLRVSFLLVQIIEGSTDFKDSLLLKYNAPLIPAGLHHMSLHNIEQSKKAGAKRVPALSPREVLSSPLDIFYPISNSSYIL